MSRAAQPYPNNGLTHGAQSHVTLGLYVTINRLPLKTRLAYSLFLNTIVTLPISFLLLMCSKNASDYNL